MNAAINTLLRGLCLLAYAAALAHAAGLLPPDALSRAPWVAALLLALHLAELPLALKHLRLDARPLALGLLLTLLFGVLHWWPLARSASASANASGAPK